MKRYFALLFPVILMTLCSCAQDSESPGTAGQTSAQGKQYISFTLKINDAGILSTGGYYIILFNSKVNGIEVTNSGTFTDGIRLYIDPMLGPTHYWFHRITRTIPCSTGW